LHPNSQLCAVLDLVTFVVLSFGLVVTPFVLAWDGHIDETMSFGALVSLLYWTVDMGLHFRIGFYRRGELELRPSAIARKYLRSSFVLDVSIVTVGWAHQVITLFRVSSGGTLDKDDEDPSASQRWSVEP